MWMRSPSATGTALLVSMGSVLSLRNVPLADPGSMRVQPPSGLPTSTACMWDTPGSSGAPERSISGLIPREALRRPMTARSFVRVKTRSGYTAGNGISSACMRS